MKPCLGGVVKVGLGGWEVVEGVFLALGSLLDLERVGTVAERKSPKRGPVWGS